MAENIEVTNEDVLRFYADKFADEKHCPITAKYLSKLKSNGESLHGDYVKTVNTFKKGVEKEKDNLKEDEQFYEWLKNTLISFSFFLPDVFLGHTDYYDVALQKWHLYVCWYEYRQSGIRSGKKLDNDQLKVSASSKPNGIFQSSITCSELLLWMCEAAGSTQTERLYKKLIDEEESDKKRIEWIREWAAKAKEEIKRIIIEERKENKI